MTKKDPDPHKIDTQGGASIEGSVSTGGGDFVGRDQNKLVVGGSITGSTLVVGNGKVVTGAQSGASLAELTRLVAELRGLLPQAGLDAETQEVVEGDFQVVESQLAKAEPKKALVLTRLKSIAEMVVTAAAVGEAAQKLAPLAQQAIQWAQQVLR